MSNTTLKKVLIDFLVECVVRLVKTVSHVVSESSKLVQRECKKRHGNVVRMFHWKL